MRVPLTIEGRDLIEIIKDKVYSEDLIKELEKYEVKRPESVWELKNKDVIWATHYDYDNSTFVGMKTQWQGWESQEYWRELGKVHLTKERAELHARVLNTELAIKKWKRENDNIELDWSDGNQKKHHLAYNAENEEIDPDWWNIYKHANTVYFSSESKTLQCIDDIGKERITEWIKWEDNDQ